MSDQPTDIIDTPDYTRPASESVETLYPVPATKSHIRIQQAIRALRRSAAMPSAGTTAAAGGPFSRRYFRGMSRTCGFFLASKQGQHETYSFFVFCPREALSFLPSFDSEFGLKDRRRQLIRCSCLTFRCPINSRRTRDEAPYPRKNANCNNLHSSEPQPGSLLAMHPRVVTRCVTYVAHMCCGTEHTVCASLTTSPRLCRVA